MKRILFTPIGGSDPIRNYRDGSMLHICRQYKPDVVYMYLSAEMYEHQKEDNRYCYCLEQLGKLLNHHFEVRQILRKNLKQVQNHEIFYDDFRKCISDIKNEISPEDELLVNISSGTPAMKNALVVLSTLGELLFKTIQVSTPLKKINRTDENVYKYDPEGEWECNEDNQGECESRCEELMSSNLSMLIQMKIIKMHIHAYDYEAAYRVAKENEDKLSENSILYLEQAKARIQLNSFRVNDIAKLIKYQPMPIRREEDRALAEYLFMLQVKEKRGNYDDFIRAITPAIANLFERLLLKNKVDVSQYVRVDSKGVRRWDEDKLKNTDILVILNQEYKQGFKTDSFIQSDHLKYLLDAKLQNEKLKKCVEDLRRIESDIRNKVAHTIFPVTQEVIKRWTGFTTKEIFRKLVVLAETIGIVGDDIWNNYDVMNQTICHELDRGLKTPSEFF